MYNFLLNSIVALQEKWRKVKMGIFLSQGVEAYGERN